MNPTKNGPSRMAREKKTIKAMVGIYCAAYHKAKTGMCDKCIGLLDYAGERLDKCPFAGKKPSCAKCTIHCYSPDMRAGVIAVMRYAGPRMIAKHPVLAVRHILDSRKAT